ncbi:exopolysaccharide biosynthesis protein [Halodurantibacterium flavum]|uniref:Exopolysaccharide biosynthesis protein n=1 Tax=Halodurantibacterium flavum TaxID=1382802 RepID=A0ABW4S6X1_9RHOB
MTTIHDPEHRNSPPPPRSLTDVFDRACTAATGEKVTLNDLVEAVGPASLPAVLLLPAVVVATPLSGIPGVSGSGGLMIALVGSQIALGRSQIWLPKWLLCRGLPARRVRGVLHRFHRVAEWLDGAVHRRLPAAASGLVRRMIGGFCAVLGLAMPLLEFIPFTSSIAAAIVAVLALALLVRDGLVALAVPALGLLALALLFGPGWPT